MSEQEKFYKRKNLENKIKGFLFLIVVIFIIIGVANSGNKTSTSPTATPTQSPTSNTTTESTKSYQEVFTFKGSGIKKSEPFTVTGDRFKIAYDCKGGYCGAYLYNVNGSLKELVFNVAGDTKDETIIYGAGEYYLEANTQGAFTMTVSDYK